MTLFFSGFNWIHPFHTKIKKTFTSVKCILGATVSHSFFFNLVAIMMQIQKSWSVFIICILSHGTHLSRVEGCRQIHPRHVRCRIASSWGWGGKSDSCDMWRATGAEKVLVISDAGSASCPGFDVRVGILLRSTPKCKLGKQGFKITTTWTIRD